MKTNQVEDSIVKLTCNFETDSYLHKIVNNETINSIIEKKIIRRKLKNRIGKLGDQHSTIKNISCKYVHVDGLKEDGSDDQKIHVYYFDVVFKEVSHTFWLGIKSVEVHSKCGCDKFGCNKFAYIDYNFGYSGLA